MKTKLFRLTCRTDQLNMALLRTAVVAAESRDSAINALTVGSDSVWCDIETCEEITFTGTSTPNKQGLPLVCLL